MMEHVWSAVLYSRAPLINHMAQEHGFNIGLPDNLGKCVTNLGKCITIMCVSIMSNSAEIWVSVSVSVSLIWVSV